MDQTQYWLVVRQWNCYQLLQVFFSVVGKLVPVLLIYLVTHATYPRGTLAANFAIPEIGTGGAGEWKLTSYMLQYKLNSMEDDHQFSFSLDQFSFFDTCGDIYNDPNVMDPIQNSMLYHSLPLHHEKEIQNWFIFHLSCNPFCDMCYRSLGQLFPLNSRVCSPDLNWNQICGTFHR